MRALVLLACLGVAACDNVDACGDQGSKTCVSLLVSGSLTIDQLRINATGGFTLHDALSPATAHAPVALPVVVALLPRTAGDFTLVVEGLRTGAVLGRGVTGGNVGAGQHTSVGVTLGAGDAGVDLSASSFDLAGHDLSDVACDLITQAPCPADQKCIEPNGKPVCRPVGGVAVGGACVVTPDDNCVRGAECQLVGSARVCVQICGGDGDCSALGVPSSGTAESANRAHCLFPLAGAPAPAKSCSLPCDPLLAASGTCAAGLACAYTGNATIAEFTFCQQPGASKDGMDCSNGTSDCAAGFSCVAAGTNFRCRQVCRTATSGDCPTSYQCKPGAGGSPPMFGYCCPTTGC